ncbi:unnamed protein product [Rhizophagus irregularis]|nr:unnamed protein product [Rhizophagus irregularis]
MQEIVRNLKFITEPEAAAIHYSFMIVDCGGGTVDLTTRQLLVDYTLGDDDVEISEIDIEELCPTLKQYCKAVVKGAVQFGIKEQ